MQQGCDSVRSVTENFRINQSSLSAGMTGKVAMGARRDPQIVLSAEEENAPSDLLVYTGSHHPGDTLYTRAEGRGTETMQRRALRALGP